MAPMAKVLTLIYAAKELQFVMLSASVILIKMFSFISCRYSTFLLLYATGISSEVGLIYLALPYMKVRNPMLC